MTMKRLCVSVLAVFVLRLALIWLGEGVRGGVAPTNGDEPVYHTMALQLADSPGAWVRPGAEFGYRAPLFFAYLAAIYHVTPNTGFSTGQIATAALGVLNCVLLFLLVRSVVNVKAAVAAFWIRGLLPAFVIPDTFVLSEPLFAAFLLAALLVLASRPHAPGAGRSIALGLLVACCVLTREAAMSYPLIFGGYLCLTGQRARDKVRSALLFAAAFVIALVPWMWRNTVVWGDPLPLSYTAGVNLHIGNNADATGGWIDIKREGRPGDARFGTPEFDTWYRQQAMSYVREHPDHFVALGFRKLAWLLWPRFARDDIKGVYPGGPARANVISLAVGASSGALMLAGLIGFALRPRDWFWWISAALVASTLAVTFVVIGDPRFRDAIDNLFVVYAASVVAELPVTLREWNSRAHATRTRRTQLLIVVPTLLFVTGCWIWVASQLHFG